MNVALVHDYLIQSGGAERVIAALHRLFPEAPIYTTLADPRLVDEMLPGADVRTSWMQRLPGRRSFRRYFLLYPAAVQSFDLTPFDLVISNSSAYAKSARTRPGACHVSYCHTPMRFAWEFERYAAREEWNAATRVMLRPMVAGLRRWDRRTAARPTGYLANSSAGAARIARWYGRPARVVHPPVDLTRFAPGDDVADFHLVVSRLVGYKRIDLAIDAFNQLGRKLLIIGEGPAARYLKTIAGPTVHFLGRIDDASVSEYYRRCRALIFPGEEDFGLTPLEANASGRPVVAFRRGGALDTVVAGATGVFFDEQTPESLARAVINAERTPWSSLALRRHAESFREAVFRDRMLEAVRAVQTDGEQDQGVSSTTIGESATDTLTRLVRPGVATAMADDSGSNTAIDGRPDTRSCTLSGATTVDVRDV